MEDNHLEEALIAIRRVMRATEINSLSLACLLYTSDAADE